MNSTLVNHFYLRPLDDQRVSTFFTSMRQLRDDRHFCDITLKADDKSFLVHRNVLAAAFPYFRSMFTTKMVESEATEVTIKDMEPAVLELLLNFAYGVKVRVDEENVYSLIRGSSFLLLLDVRDDCIKFLTSRISPKNVIETKRLADFMGFEELAATCDMYIRYNFAKVAISEEFKSLQLDELTDIIKSNNLNVTCEEIVFDAIITWVEYNKDLRGKLLLKILEHIRLPLLSLQYLSDKVSKEELIISSLQSKCILEEAYRFHTMLASKDKTSSNLKSNYRACVNDAGLIYVICVGYENALGNLSFEVFDPLKKNWESREEMTKTNTRNFNIAVLEGKLYAFGDEYNVFTTEIYNSKKNKWFRVCDTLTEKENMKVAVLNNRAYVCGGVSDPFTAVDSVECYCTKTNKWNALSPMLTRRFDHCVVEINGFLYALGGINIGVLNSVEQYNPNDDTWREKRPMLRSRHSFGAAAFNGKIYVCGGRNDFEIFKTVEAYDPLMNTWEVVTPMLFPRTDFILLANFGQLYAIGGANVNEQFVSSTEVYDPKEDKWTLLNPMNRDRMSLKGCVLPY